MNFKVLTLFPDMIRQVAETSILGRASEKELISIEAVDIRDFSADKNRRVDDYTYGGGAGMLMQAQPVYDAYKAVSHGRKIRTIYVTPQGKPFSQADAQELSLEDELIFLCGHYEGIDERVLNQIVTDRFSIGDYVLTGGELPSLVMIDAISRLVTGVLGNESSSEVESFDRGLLEYPQYTRPPVWEGMSVPEVLLSGNTKEINKWRLQKSIELTQKVRPDLYADYMKRQEILEAIGKKKRFYAPFICALQEGTADILMFEKKDADIALLLYLPSAQLYIAAAGNEVLAEEVVSLIPEDFQHMVCCDTYVSKLLVQRDYETHCEVVNGVYTKNEHAPKASVSIKALTLADVDYVAEHYHLVDDASYVIARIKQGKMFGAYIDGNIVGFIGFHREGSIGMLFVDEAFRGQGIAQALESYMINLRIDEGILPYGQIIIGNEASIALQNKMGLYLSNEILYWMSHK